MLENTLTENHYLRSVVSNGNNIIENWETDDGDTIKVEKKNTVISVSEYFYQD